MARQRRTAAEHGAQELNGWKVEELQETVRTIEQQPEQGLVQWTVSTKWDGGFGLDTRTRRIHQMDAELARHFTIRSDHPPELLGHNSGPTAVEILLCGLGACITGTYAAHATAQGITIRDLWVELEGEIDLNGFLQLRDSRAGLRYVRARVHVGSDASDEQLEELLNITRRASPVFDSVANPVAIDATVERTRQNAPGGVDHGTRAAAGLSSGAVHQKLGTGVAGLP